MGKLFSVLSLRPWTVGMEGHLPPACLFCVLCHCDSFLNLSASGVVQVVHEILISDLCFDDAVILRRFQQM